jgi:hypothetical protein
MIISSGIRCYVLHLKVNGVYWCNLPITVAARAEIAQSVY